MVTAALLAWVFVPLAIIALVWWRSPERPLTPEEAREQADAISRYLKRH